MGKKGTAGAAGEGGLDFEELARRFDGPGVSAIALMGSYARGKAGTYSDVDLLRLLDEQATLSGSGSHLVDGRLVVVSDAAPPQVEEWFTRPEVAVNVIAGLRSGQALIDRKGAFSGVQIRARAFVWESGMQERANAWASQQMVGWIEEVHKGLEGLSTADTGRLLHARFGCSWGLTRVMQVQRGVLVSGENAFYDEVAVAVGPTSEWVRLRRVAFGIDDIGRRPPSLRAQVTAGLQLYVVTAELLKEILRPVDAPLVAHAVAQIKQALGTQPTGQTTEALATQPAGQSEEEPGTQAAGQSEEVAGKQPTGQSEEAPGTQPAGQTAEAPLVAQAVAHIKRALGRQPAGQTTEESSAQLAGPGEQEASAEPAGQGEDEAGKQPTGHTAEAPRTQPIGQGEQEASPEPADQSEEEPGTQPTGQSEEEAGKQPAGE